MNTITPENADEHFRRLIGGEPLEPSLHTAGSVPWVEIQPLSWADFLAILVNYCHARQWEIIYDSPDKLSLAIFARPDSPAPTPATQLSEEELQRMQDFILADN